MGESQPFDRDAALDAIEALAGPLEDGPEAGKCSQSVPTYFLPTQLVLPARIELTSLASETNALSIVLQERAMQRR
jgi:hypothetical protein